MDDGEDSPVLGTAGRQQRASLSSVPDEIIEQIANNLYDGIIGDGPEYAQCYMLENRTDFSHLRFHLSSFSKVCAAVRWPVERVLYRDIHVHFGGWNEDLINSKWRGGSLRLLLRTLEGRVDLCGCVKSVQMDWFDEMDDLEEEESAVVKDALRQFFSCCPLVQRLNIKTFPSHIFSEMAAFSQITTLATSGPELDTIWHIVVKTFPVLQDLYLNVDFVDTPAPTPLFRCRLKKFRIDSIEIGVHCVFWALEVCADITEELHLTCSGYFMCRGRPRPQVDLPTLSPSAGTNLQTLRLVGNQLNFLADPNSMLAQAIRQLPSLQHLHMSTFLPFHAVAFSVLPASLRCLSLSEYGSRKRADYGRSHHEFVVALSDCLAQALRVIEMVSKHGVAKEGLESQVFGDLSPLQSVCNDRNIPFHCDAVNSKKDWLHGEIRILFA